MCEYTECIWLWIRPVRHVVTRQGIGESGAHVRPLVPQARGRPRAPRLRVMAMAAATSTTCSGGAVAGVGGRGSAAARRQAPRRAAPRAVASTSSSVQLARPLGLTLASGPGDNGVWVEDIVAGSNAEASGAFAAGDVVTAVDGWQCAGEPFEDVLAVLAAGGEGDSVELELNRAGEGALTGVAGRIALAANAQREGVTVTASGLQYEVLSEGKGRKVASVNDSCVVHYEVRASACARVRALVRRRCAHR